MDRKKIISRLYDIGGFIVGRIGIEQAQNFLQTIDDVVELLKEQEAVEPINSYGTFRCKKCKNIVGYNDGSGRGYQNNFCSKCGKGVKWE